MPFCVFIVKFKQISNLLFPLLKQLWTDKYLLVRSLKITLACVQINFDIIFLQRAPTNDANKQNIESKSRQHSQSIHSSCSLFLESWQNHWKMNVKEFAVSKVVSSRLATLLKNSHRYFTNMVGKYLWWNSVLVMLQASGLQLYWKTTISQEFSKDFAKIVSYFPSFLIKFRNSFIQGTPHSGCFWYSQTHSNRKK